MTTPAKRSARAAIEIGDRIAATLRDMTAARGDPGADAETDALLAAWEDARRRWHSALESPVATASPEARIAMERLRRERIRRGLSIRALARACAAAGEPVSFSYIAAIERQVAVPSPAVIASLARALQLDVVSLFQPTDEVPDHVDRRS